jgi:hypothetical protein
MFNPNQHPAECEKYLGSCLGSPVKFIHASQLTQSTRAAPWRLDVAVNGQEQAYVLQLDARGLEYEYQILKALETSAVPTPRAYGLDLAGEALGVPCFFSAFIAGESLLNPMLAGEPWAEELYLDAVCDLQAITIADLGEAAASVEQESAGDVLEDAWAYFKDHSQPLAEALTKNYRPPNPNFPRYASAMAICGWIISSSGTRNWLG